MNIDEDPEFYNELKSKNRGPTTRGLVLPFAGNAVSMAKDALLNLIDNQKERLTNTWQQAQTDLYFYNKISQEHPLDPSGMQFSGFKISREQNIEGKTDTTFFAKFSVDTSNPIEILNNSIFRLKLDKLKVNNTQLPDSKRWFLPWSWFSKQQETINLDFTITVLGSWIDDDMKLNKHIPMGEFYLILREVPLRGTDSYESYISEKIGTQLTGYSYLIPRSLSFQKVGDRIQKIYGHGLYSLEVDVVESRNPGNISTTTTEIIEKSGLLK